jgi:hypothetical protein
LTYKISSNLVKSLAAYDGLKVTNEEAGAWLTRNQNVIQERLLDATKDIVADLIQEDIPESGLSDMLDQMEEAFHKAALEYAAANKAELAQTSNIEADFRKIAREFMAELVTTRKVPVGVGLDETPSGTRSCRAECEFTISGKIVRARIC